MEVYRIEESLGPWEGFEEPEGCWLGILVPEELENRLPGWVEGARLSSGSGARSCRAEVRPDCLWGTIAVPDPTEYGHQTGFFFTMNERRILFVDASGTAQACVKRIAKEKRWKEGTLGRFLYDFLETLLIRDPRYLEELEERVEKLENSVLNGNLDAFSPKLMAVRKLLMARFRFYSQLENLCYEFKENENGFFSEEEVQRFHLFEGRIERLRDETQRLREYCVQVRELFQAEIDIRQNKVMKILTIVTTVFMPLSLLVGWYGMNFRDMPELTWQYGYPGVILVGAGIVALSLWVCKRKKFW